jgi:HAD superfamily hydrolase (TIGR01549 family)
MAERPEAIFFDVGNTLLFPNWTRILAPLIERGIMPTHEQLQLVERHAKNEFDQMVTSGQQDLGFWRLFYMLLLDLLDLDDLALVDTLTESTRSSANWDRIRPGTREALEQLGNGWRIAVISNADGRIAEILKLCGIGDCFLTITDSGIVGHEKPHPAIFAAALQSLNVGPERALYVGDVYSVDYIGARQVGMEAILFDIAGAYRDKGLPRVESLSELNERLKSIQ